MLQLGTAKVDITPGSPVRLAGFAHRSGVFNEVVTPLSARVLCFRYGSAEPIFLVSADLIWWAGRMARTETGVVVLHATHNHSGPQTSEAFSPEIGEASPAYLQMLEESVRAGLKQAMAVLEPVTVERGIGRCEIGINRRRMVDGHIRMAPNSDGPVDPECTVIRFRKLDGSTKSVMVHYTCHPTTTADNSVSAEFCGAAMTEIENELGGEAIAAYLQGCCGDIRPAMIRDGEFYRGGAADVRRLGSELAAVVLDVLSRPMEHCEPVPCSAAATELPLFFEAGQSVPLEMTRIVLARGLGILTFNAEMVVEYGLFVKQFTGGTMLPVAYSDGMIGYVTTQRQLEEGGYESREAFRYFGMPGPFALSTESRIRDAIAKQLPSGQRVFK